MNILLINNEVSLTNAIKLFFVSRHLWQVKSCLHARELTNLSKSSLGEYDAIILNINLPYEDGISLCKRIRKVSDLPILIMADIQQIVGSHLPQKLMLNQDEVNLSALTVKAMNAGADDLVACDIPVSELFARVKNVVSRCTSRARSSELEDINHRYMFSFAVNEHVFFDMRKMHISSDFGLDVELTTSEGELLVIFLKAPRKMLSRDYLIQKIKMRDYHGSGDRFIDVRVGMLRKKLLDYQHKYIRTIRGKGYFFDAETVKALS